MPRRILTDAGVAALRPKAARYAYPDPELRAHYVRVTPAGNKSYVVAVRDPNGKQIWHTVGTADLIGIETAREAARDAIKRIRAGLPAIEKKAPASSFQAVADNYFRRHVEGRGLLSAKEVRRIFDKYVLPVLGGRDFATIRRSDVATLLDKIEDDNGARQADYCLAILRSLFNWFSARDDTFINPIVKGMRRTAPSQTKRQRILMDDEIRKLWEVAGTAGTFGAMMRLALATAQRREKLMTLKWTDISVDGVWDVPSDERQKGTGGELKLSELALGVVRAQSRIGDNPYVFAGRGDGHFNGMSKAKVSIDAKLGFSDWTIHDLRRTARSLMSRAGVRPDISERVLGHVIGGVEGTYDRHLYREEKADALARLARLLGSIIDPSTNVVPLRGAQ